MRIPALILTLAFSLHAWALPPAHEEARSDLLRGVGTVDSGGVPGTVLCVGTNAFPVVGAKCGEAVQPVIAACFYGNGRVVAAGHPSFYHAESVGKVDTAVFIENAVRWLGKGRVEVAVYKNDSAVKALIGIKGLSVRKIDSLDALAGTPVLVANPDDLKPDEVERVRAYITSGGGLLAAGIGWGWQQVTHKSLVTDNLFNRLMGSAGLLINADYAGRTASDGYLVRFALPDGINAMEALRLAVAGNVTDRAVQKQISQTLCAVMAVLPPGDSQIANGLKILGALPAAAKLPSPKAPLKVGDMPARLTLIQHQTEWRTKPLDPWPAHPAAAVYPGEMPKDTPRGNRTLTVNLSIPRWRGTGLYAAAGEPVTVELPPDAEKLGLKLRIGSTTCDNTRHNDWLRAPKVDVEVPLNSKRVTVSSPFGGLLYVVVPKEIKAPAPTEVKLTIRNACQSVWFKEGRDTLTAWRGKIRAVPSPWAEIESDKIILTVPSDGCGQTARRAIPTIEFSDR